jgi:hypothetical protein
MKTTPRLAIPYAEPGDDINAYPVDVDLPAASLVESMWFGGAAWSTLPPAFSGSIRYRQVGGLMYVQLDLSGTFVSGTIYNWSATPMPAGLRPQYTSRGYADFNGYAGGIGIGPDGMLTGRHQSGSNRSNISSTAVYLIA